MNRYLIKYKLATVAELREPFILEGYEFSSYDSKWWQSDGWVASKELEAENSGYARHEFMKGLFNLFPEFSVISQCAFRYTANSYFVYKLTDNQTNVIFINYVREVPPVGLQFEEEEKSNLLKIHNIHNKHALFFIADAANATSFYTKLSMLLIGIEGLAGEIDTKNGKRTNKTVLKEILGNDLFEKLFPDGKLRNLLFHGSVKDHTQFDGLTEELYACIRTYLYSKYNITLETNVVNPQRSFYGNFEQASAWEAFKNESNLDLKTICDSFEQDRHSLFTFVESPTDY